MLEEGSECVQAELEAIRGETGADILWPPALNYRELNSTGECFCPLDILLFLKMLRTAVIAVRSTPLTNIPKGFSSEISLA